MLKRLVKYGNSNALVLDKPLLKLLNINEGATIKITTDGKSLIISPVEISKQEISATIVPQETLSKAIQNNFANLSSLNNPQDGQDYLNEVTEVIKKAGNDGLENPEKRKEVEGSIQQIGEKYKIKKNTQNFCDQMEAFKKVHEKYKEAHGKFAKLQENETYIHESVLLAEKYHNSRNSLEYIKEFNDLIVCFIPEWAAYQEEVKTIGQNFAQ